MLLVIIWSLVAIKTAINRPFKNNVYEANHRVSFTPSKITPKNVSLKQSSTWVHVIHVHVCTMQSSSATRTFTHVCRQFSRHLRPLNQHHLHCTTVHKSYGCWLGLSEACYVLTCVCQLKKRQAAEKYSRQ